MTIAALTYAHTTLTWGLDSESRKVLTELSALWQRRAAEQRAWRLGTAAYDAHMAALA